MARWRLPLIGAAAAALLGGVVAISARQAHEAVPIRVAPYVDMGSCPTPALSALSKASGVKSYTLGFVTTAGCRASWFNAYDPRSCWQLSEIKKIRSAGGDVKVPFGGASGIDLAQGLAVVSSAKNNGVALDLANVMAMD